MANTAHGWNVFDDRAPILTFDYSFGPARANALAVGGEAGLFVVSPPRRVATGVFDDLAAFGPVIALVASNAFHHLGLPEWKRRFPDAALFAPAQSIARVERQSKLSGIRPVAEAAALAGAHLELVDMPYYRTGEVLVRIRTAQGLVWYATDWITNMRELPGHPLAKWMFRLSRSAPGLKLNHIAPVFMVRDRSALKRWLASEIARAPPHWLIPAHGAIVDWSTSKAARTLFAPS